MPGRRPMASNHVYTDASPETVSLRRLRRLAEQRAAAS